MFTTKKVNETSGKGDSQQNMETSVHSAPSEARISLPWSLLLSYGLGHVLNDICASMWFTYLLVFFHLVLKFDTFSSGVILLIGQIADAVSTPFVGIESDKNNDSFLCRYGKRKTWHLVGTICVLGSFPFIFTPCISCRNAHVYAQMVYYSSFVIIFQFGWAAVQISHLALIPELTPNKNQRTQLTAIRYGFTVISTVLIYVVTWISLKTGEDIDPSNQIGPNDAFNFQRVVYIGLIIGFITSIIFHWGVKEESTQEKQIKERNHKTIFQFMKDIQFYQIAIVYMSSRLFVNLVQIYIPLYVHETLVKKAEHLAVIPLVMYLGSIAASSFVNYINRVFGRKIAYLCGSLIGISACAWIKVGYHHEYEIYLVAILLGISGSVLIVTALGLTADLIGFDTGTGAFVYGSMSFVDKLSNGIAVIVIQSLRDCSNTDFYKNVLVFACGGAALVGILPLITLKTKVRFDTSVKNDEERPVLGSVDS